MVPLQLKDTLVILLKRKVPSFYSILANTPLQFGIGDLRVKIQFGLTGVNNDEMKCTCAFEVVEISDPLGATLG